MECPYKEGIIGGGRPDKRQDPYSCGRVSCCDNCDSCDNCCVIPKTLLEHTAAGLELASLLNSVVVCWSMPAAPVKDLTEALVSTPTQAAPAPPVAASRYSMAKLLVLRCDLVLDLRLVGDAERREAVVRRGEEEGFGEEVRGGVMSQDMVQCGGVLLCVGAMWWCIAMRWCNMCCVLFHTATLVQCSCVLR